MIVEEENYLAHYGILRKSGRYPWGSGKDPAQRSKQFIDHVASLRKEGMTDTQIAEGFGMTTTELRATSSIAKNQKKQADIGQAQRLKDKGYSNVEIGKHMGINESSVRSLLAPGQQDKVDILQSTAAMLRKNVDEKKYVDIGSGVENQLKISDTKLKTAVAMLKSEGYAVHTVQTPQMGTNNKTLVKVLAPPGTTYKDIVTNMDQIHQIQDRSDDGGRNFYGIHPPLNISSSRVAIRYAEQGGTEADGVMYVRPGVKDVSLGASRYAQVRVAVDGTHYLKGMAMYKDDLPAGVDIMFNTNKSDTGNKLDALKKQSDDPDNPFGAVISQIGEKDHSGRVTKVTSAMNIVNEEGNWDAWSKNLSSQMLSKQSPQLAKAQLGITHENKKADLDEILSLTNPAVRKKLLESYADDADSSAVHLRAAQMPRQRSQVILPIASIKPHEVYAPNFRDGEKVVLVRHPHGGTFEIPELTVNNKSPEAKSILGRVIEGRNGPALDAIGIHHTVAARLSGADFDGDTVLVIPNDSRKIKTSPALESLKNFDPQSAYKAYEGMPKMSAREKGLQMGLISNLITDMTIKGANVNELARAVRHSMVVIDAEKHNLNYKQSSIDHGIPQLMKRYQGRAQGGSSTLISKAKSPVRVLERKPRPASEGGPIDKATGKKVFVETGNHWVNAKGQTVYAKTTSKKLIETDDAHTLSSGTPIESIYADHSNRMKALADTARKEAVNTTTIPYSPSAKKAYANEVQTLNAKLNLALENRPRERQAQLLANATVHMKKQASPEMDDTQLKRVKFQALEEARNRTGAKKDQVVITEKEWAAIQAGAISNNKLTQILNNADLDRVKQLATPKATVLMTSAKTSRARQMLASGYTQAEVADQLGVSLTTLKKTIGGIA